MQTVIEGLRQILGKPQFYDVATGAWHYDLMIEYFVGATLLVVVVASVFRLISKVVSR